MPVHRWVGQSALNLPAPISLYVTWVERDTVMGVRSFAQEHSTMTPAKPQTKPKGFIKDQPLDPFSVARYLNVSCLVVGSCLCSEDFSPGSPVFFPPQKSTFLNSNLIGNSRATGLSVERLLCVTLVKQSLFIYLI